MRSLSIIFALACTQAIALSAAHASEDFKSSLEICSKDPDAKARAACYAAVGAAQSKKADLETFLRNLRDAGGETKKDLPPYNLVTKKDPIDGSPYLEAIVRSTDHKDTTFHLRCARNVTSAFISTNALGLFFSNKLKTEFRTGRMQPVSTTWPQVDGSSNFGYPSGRQAIPLIRRLANSDKLVVRVFPTKDREMTFQFPISKAHADLPRIATACNWKIEGSSDIPVEAALPTTPGLEAPSRSILIPTITNKRFQDRDLSNHQYEQAIYFDLSWQAKDLQKPTRAIKGILVLADLFGEAKLRIGWIVNDSVSPGGKVFQRGLGFKYNRFKSNHAWVRTTDLKDIKVWFEAEEIIYRDGETQKFTE